MVDRRACGFARLSKTGTTVIASTRKAARRAQFSELRSTYRLAPRKACGLGAVPGLIWTSPGSRGLYLSWHADCRPRLDAQTIPPGWYSPDSAGPRGWKLDPRQHEKRTLNTSTGSASRTRCRILLVGVSTRSPPTILRRSWWKRSLRASMRRDQLSTNRVANLARLPSCDHAAPAIKRCESAASSCTRGLCAPCFCWASTTRDAAACL